MALHSMTGFARTVGAWNGWTWNWEVKSVNGKGLDVRCRLPNGQESLEVAVREGISKRLKRGSVNASLTLEVPSASREIRLNEAALRRLPDMVEAIAAQVPRVTPPSIDGLLALRWLLEEGDAPSLEGGEELSRLVLADLDRVLDDLVAARAEEGRKLDVVVRNLLADMTELHSAAGESEALRPQALRERMHRQLDELLGDRAGLDPDRLAQEVAILVAKIDVREELDRLGAHLESAMDLVNTGGAVGRKLDFLCQEFNREANTLCAKSQDIKLTRVGLDLKSRIDQLREQVQNIE